MSIPGAPPLGEGSRDGYLFNRRVAGFGSMRIADTYGHRVKAIARIGNVHTRACLAPRQLPRTGGETPTACSRIRDIPIHATPDMPHKPAPPPAQAFLVVGPGCPHCASLLSALTDLVKSGELGRLEVVNAEADPRTASALGLRSVPWLRMGGFVFTGAMSTAALRRWLSEEGTLEGDRRYFAERLRQGELSQVNALLSETPQRALALVDLMGRDDTGLDLRAGIAAAFETMEGTATYSITEASLGALSGSDNSRVRADACHLLSTINTDSARSWLSARRDDPDPLVREIVSDALDG
ncbi:MAG: thioredoxin family protein [Gammaproteobacteria bacterium]